MKISKVNSGHNFPKFLLMSLALSALLRNCAIVPTLREIPYSTDVSGLQDRRDKLNKISGLTGSGQLVFSGETGGGTLFFDMELQTPDSLKFHVQDPLGRRLADIELSGETYHLRLVREGKYYTGTQINTEQLPFKFGELDPGMIRHILLGLPLRGDCDPAGSENQATNQLSGIRYKFKPGRAELSEIIWQQDDRRLRIIYKKYMEVAGIKLPADIEISDALSDLNVEIHFSHFNAGMIKFQTQ
ncbi:MAG: hypothetical protein V1681_00665 [Candidatus Neomarinimicrobiota bacterium]